MTYAEYLKSQGATDDEIKILVTPVTTKAFDTMQANLTTATSERDAAKLGQKTYEDWYNKQAVPYVQKLEREVVVSAADSARTRTALLTLQERGLIDIAKDLGLKPDELRTPPNPVAPAAAAPDPRYVTGDSLVEFANREGEAIATAQDIVSEHMQLFPNDQSKRLSMRELRAKAIAQHKSVEQVWMETFNVDQVRRDRQLADKTAYETKLREEGAATERTRLADQYGNPELRPLMSSRSPLAPRPNTGREKQPWESGDRSNDRVAAATKKVMEATSGPGYGRTN